jgi:hypothetical protein
LRAAEAAGDAAARDAARQQLEAARAEQQAAAQPTAQAAAPATENEAPDYAPLSPRYPQESSGRRSALARWIASRDNPLTARVAANHLWLRHFGQPLVASTHDFGRQGTPPSHPELLDWLACELMDSGWSMRHVHRLIVTSGAYRQASDAPLDSTEALPSIATWRERDPGNRLLWRFPDQRMQAEVVRDSLLAAAGALDPTIGGHEIDLREGLRSRRRSIYFSHHGEERMEFLELFDAASPMECYQRTASVQPQQALALANSELCASLSRELTRRLTDERAPSEDFAQRFVQRAFAGILNRAPTPAELQASVEFLTTQQHALAADGLVAEGDRQQRCRENLVHALLNHHDFVTIR